MWHLGLLLGGLVGVAVPFLTWVYLVVSIHLILVILGRVVDLRRLGEVVAVSPSDALLAVAFSVAGLVLVVYSWGLYG